MPSYTPPGGGSLPVYGPGRVGGVVTGPWGGVHPGGTIVSHPGTIAPGGYSGGVVIGPNGFAGGVGLGHSTTYIGPTAMRSIGNGIRGMGYPYFTHDWYRNHVRFWLPPIWWGGVGVWFVLPWDTVAPFIGIPGPPIVYTYGSTAVIQDGTMYLNGVSVGSATDYAAQAIALDDSGRTAMPAASDEWQPLGVFGLIQSNENFAQRIFQLAVNKAGIVRGNYYDAVSDSNQPIYGAIDKKSQRVAWSIGDRKDIVFEAGLNNLIQNETTVLIHYGKERTQQMMLVRLGEPQQK
jgi:hypothetical protein